jgi:hypothetical protein
MVKAGAQDDQGCAVGKRCGVALPSPAMNQATSGDRESPVRWFAVWLLFAFPLACVVGRCIRFGFDRGVQEDVLDLARPDRTPTIV